MTKKVLDVGQCNFDHGRISAILERDFDVEIQRADSFDEATKMAADVRFDLILINRLMDTDGSPGMAILHDLKTRPDTTEVPVMIVSNYQDAHDTAIESGAVQGFGKADLDSEATRVLLSAFLA